MLFDNCRTTTEQGNIGEAYAIAYFTKMGTAVSKPLFINSDYDLIIDTNGKLERVQIKTTKYKKYKSYVVNLKTSGCNARAHAFKAINRESIDKLFILADDGTQWVIPVANFVANFELSLTEVLDRYKI